MEWVVGGVSSLLELDTQFSPFCTDKGITSFCFSSRTSMQLCEGYKNAHRSIQFYWLLVLGYPSKEEISCCASFSIRCSKIRGIRVDVKYHIGFFVSDFCTRVHCAEIKKLFNSFHREYCGFGLFSSLSWESCRNISDML